MGSAILGAAGLIALGGAVALLGTMLGKLLVRVLAKRQSPPRVIVKEVPPVIRQVETASVCVLRAARAAKLDAERIDRHMQGIAHG